MSESQGSRVRRNAMWAVPTVAALVAAGGIGYGVLGAGAAGGLPPKSAQEILTGMQQAGVPALSGTVVAKADLGLPDMPGMSDSPELTSLVSGSHTLRVWYDGPERVRLAKLGDAGETDVVRNGRDAWIWSSTDKTATHHTLPADTPKGHTRPSDAPSMPATPQEASQQILERLGQDSTVTTNSVSRVAGRDAYELVITPKQKNTLVKDVRLAVDGETMMPLRVQVNSTKLSSPAYEVGFTSLDLGDVEDRLFTFTPPAGTTVTEGDDAKGGAADSHGKGAHGKGVHTKGDKKGADAHGLTTTGDGWGRVYVMDAGEGALNAALSGGDAGPAESHGHRASANPADMLAALPQTSGAWGSGRVLDGTLFSAVITDDGRIAMGAVPAADLTASLAKTAR